jgi:RHS repeat-associated protein
VKFTGQERDAETGLDYFGARYFSSAQGRFTSPDAPFADQHLEEPQTWNLYAYVANNPLRYIDADGRQRIDQILDAEARAYLAGKMTPQQMLENQKARAVGAVIGIGIAAAPELPWIARALITLGLTRPQAAQEGAVAIAEAALGMEGPGTPSLTGNLGRLSQAELSTGTALASRLGRNLSVSGHVGSEFVDALGKTYDAMGSANAFQHPKFDIGKFADSMLGHFRKSNNHTVIDLRGATKEQMKEIRKRAGDIAGSSDHFIFID